MLKFQFWKHHDAWYSKPYSFQMENVRLLGWNNRNPPRALLMRSLSTLQWRKATTVRGQATRMSTMFTILGNFSVIFGRFCRFSNTSMISNILCSNRIKCKSDNIISYNNNNSVHYKSKARCNDNNSFRYNTNGSTRSNSTYKTNNISFRNIRGTVTGGLNKRQLL